jgi:hypothetical protein
VLLLNVRRDAVTNAAVRTLLLNKGISPTLLSMFFATEA